MYSTVYWLVTCHSFSIQTKYIHYYLPKVGEEGMGKLIQLRCDILWYSWLKLDSRYAWLAFLSDEQYVLTIMYNFFKQLMNFGNLAKFGRNRRQIWQPFRLLINRKNYLAINTNFTTHIQIGKKLTFTSTNIFYSSSVFQIWQNLIEVFQLYSKLSWVGGGRKMVHLNLIFTSNFRIGLPNQGPGFGIFLINRAVLRKSL